MSSLTCPLCGLRYPARPLLDLHIREDHAQRDDKPAAPPPRTERTSWAETARRALNRMIGRAA